MIAAIIVVGTGLLAIAFCTAWLARPGLRRRIESPKHVFQQHVRQYDRRLNGQRTQIGASDDDAT